MIKRLKIKNFKSFKDIDVELGNLNVIIGANASGKSNFISAIKFLRDIARSGLEKAIDEQKGIKYLQNFNIGKKDKINFEIESVLNKCTYHDLYEDLLKFIEIEIKNQKYKFIIEIGIDDKVKIDTDKAEVHFVIYESPVFDNKNIKGIPIHGELNLEHIDRKLNVNYRLDDEKFEKILKENNIVGGTRLLPNTLILSLPLFYIRPLDTDIFRNIFISDFDFRAIQKSVPINEGKELKEDASNIAMVLKQLLTDESKRKTLLNLIKYALSFVEDIEAEEYLNNAYIFNLKEAYSQKKVPSFLLSEGTINIIALLIVAYFQDNPVIVFDEITRGIHPYLLSRVMNLLKEVSKEKQIIITTHSPEILKHVNIQDILLVSRDKEGYSIIDKPARQEEVNIFIKNNIGIDDLFAKNLLRNPS
jgi:predicted ATPase